MSIQFKYEIGQNIKDDKRDLYIIDRKIIKRKHSSNNNWIINDKYYKYHCNKCGNEDWFVENNILKQKQNCNTCSNRKIVLGINTIWDKARWMCDLGVSEEDAKKYSRCSNKKIKVICPDCSTKKEITPNNIYNYKSICCICNSKISYSEKLMYFILKRLGMVFDCQYKPKWCKFLFNNKDRQGIYDFILKDFNILIEVDGYFHKHTNHLSGQTVEESKYIDNMKDKLALENGYEVIRVDCDYKNALTKFDYIKQNILNSKLNKLVDLSNVIDLKESEFYEYSINNNEKIRNIIKLYNDGYEVQEINDILKISIQTIIKYLKIGTNNKLCEYNGDKNSINALDKARKSQMKAVEIFKNGVSLGKFESFHELDRKSEKLFKIKLNFRGISEAIKNNSKYKGFDFIRI